MVFEKFENWTFASPSASELFSRSWTLSAQRGFQLHSASAAGVQGRSCQAKIGIQGVVDIAVLATGDGATVQLRFRADVRADVAAGGAVVAVLLLPVAVVGAALSWHEYEQDWSRERWEYWSFLVNTVSASPAVTSPPPPPLAPSAGPVTPSAPSATVPPRGGKVREAPGEARTQPPGERDGAPGDSREGDASARCPSCGAPAAGAGRFCASCGTAMTHDAAG